MTHLVRRSFVVVAVIEVNLSLLSFSPWSSAVSESVTINFFLSPLKV